MLIRMLPGSRILRAPEDDRGSASDDLDEDFSLDPPDDDQQDDEPPPQRQSRGENRVAKLAREAKEAKEKADRLEREMAEIRSQVTRPTHQAETPEQREARLSQMTWEDRQRYEMNELRQENQRFLQQLQFQQEDANDRVAFAQLCADKPVAAKLKDEVEKRLQDIRKQGINVPRLRVLQDLIGERALQNAGKATTRARNAADRNGQRQAARPPSGGRGDAPSEGRGDKSKSSRDKRVEGYQL